MYRRRPRPVFEVKVADSHRFVLDRRGSLELTEASQHSDTEPARASSQATNLPTTVVPGAAGSRLATATDCSNSRWTVRIGSRRTWSLSRRHLPPVGR